MRNQRVVNMFWRIARPDPSHAAKTVSLRYKLQIAPRRSAGASLGAKAMCRYAFYGPYQSHYACFDCRKAFKRANEEEWPAHLQPGDGEQVPAPCPQCGKPMADLGLEFKPPPRKDMRALGGGGIPLPPRCGISLLRLRRTGLSAQPMEGRAGVPGVAPLPFRRGSPAGEDRVAAEASRTGARRPLAVMTFALRLR